MKIYFDLLEIRDKLVNLSVFLLPYIPNSENAVYSPGPGANYKEINFQ